MSVQMKVGPMTPMYTYLWTAIGQWLGPYPPAGVNVGEIRVLSRRLAIYIMNSAPMWFHVCHPRTLYKKVNNLDQRSGRDVAFDVNWNTSSNMLSKDCCRKCGYELTKKEQMIVTLGVLGIKR